MKLKTIVNILFLLLLLAQFSGALGDEETCTGAVDHFGYPQEIFYDLQGEKCCGHSLIDNKIVRDC